MDRRLRNTVTTTLKRGGLIAKLAVVIALSTVVVAQIQIRTEYALQGINPMNPTQVGHPVITGKNQTPDQLLGSFIVTNYGAKTVQSLEYGWRIAAPLTCIDSTLKPEWDHANVNISIAPGASTTIDAHSKLASSGTSKHLAEAADTHKTPVVLVTVGLLKVTYADGSTWTDEEAVTRQTFDGGMHEKIAGCQRTQAKQTGSSKCGGPRHRDIDQLEAKGAMMFVGGSCNTLYCTAWQIINGTCDFEQCDIYCCGIGCTLQCTGQCDSSTLLPTRCHQVSVW